VGFSAFMV